MLLTNFPSIMCVQYAHTYSPPSASVFMHTLNWALQPISQASFVKFTTWGHCEDTADRSCMHDREKPWNLSSSSFPFYKLRQLSPLFDFSLIWGTKVCRRMLVFEWVASRKRSLDMVWICSTSCSYLLRSCGCGSGARHKWTAGNRVVTQTSAAASNRDWCWHKHRHNLMQTCLSTREKRVIPLHCTLT